MSLHSFSRYSIALSILTLVGGARLAQAAEITTLQEHPVMALLQMLDGEYDSTEKSCLAIRTKLLAQRTSLKASKKWRDVTGSEAYKMLAHSQKSLKDAKCGEATASQEQTSCQAMTEKVQQHATSLAETTQWKAFTSSKPTRELVSKVAKAKQENCIKSAPETKGMK